MSMINVKKGDFVLYYVKTAGSRDQKEGTVDRVYRPLFGKRMVVVQPKDSAIVDIVPNGQITGKVI